MHCLLKFYQFPIKQKPVVKYRFFSIKVSMKWKKTTKYYRIKIQEMFSLCKFNVKKTFRHNIWCVHLMGNDVWILWWCQDDVNECVCLCFIFMLFNFFFFLLLRDTMTPMILFERIEFVNSNSIRSMFIMSFGCFYTHTHSCTRIIRNRNEKKYHKPYLDTIHWHIEKDGKKKKERIVCMSISIRNTKFWRPYGCW